MCMEWGSVWFFIQLYTDKFFFSFFNLIWDGHILLESSFIICYETLSGRIENTLKKKSEQENHNTKINVSGQITN